MAGKRNYEWPLATAWDSAASMTQDKAGGVTESITPALVETKLEADGFPKIPSPTTNNVAVYGAGGWSTIRLANTHIDAAAAIEWSKLSVPASMTALAGVTPANNYIAYFTGALTSALTFVSSFTRTIWSLADAASYRATLAVLPIANPTATGTFTAPAICNTGGIANALIRWDGSGNEIASGVTDDGSSLDALGRDFFAKTLYSIKGASDTYGAGSLCVLRDSSASPTKVWTLQLGASNTLDFWNYAGASFARRVQILADGTLRLISLAGTGTRPVAVDSTGQIVAGSPRSSSVSSGAGVSGAETTVFTIGYLYGDSEIVLRGDSHATATGQIVRIRDNGNLLASFSIPAYKNFTIKAFIYNGGLRSECAIGEDGLSANVVLKSFGNSFTLTNTLTITTASDSLPPFVQSVTVR